MWNVQPRAPAAAQPLTVWRLLAECSGRIVHNITINCVNFTAAIRFPSLYVLINFLSTVQSPLSISICKSIMSSAAAAVSVDGELFNVVKLIIRWKATFIRGSTYLTLLTVWLRSAKRSWPLAFSICVYQLASHWVLAQHSASYTPSAWLQLFTTVSRVTLMKQVVHFIYGRVNPMQNNCAHTLKYPHTGLNSLSLLLLTPLSPVVINQMLYPPISMSRTTGCSQDYTGCRREDATPCAPVHIPTYSVPQIFKSKMKWVDPLLLGTPGQALQESIVADRTETHFPRHAFCSQKICKLDWRD